MRQSLCNCIETDSLNKNTNKYFVLNYNTKRVQSCSTLYSMTYCGHVLEANRKRDYEWKILVMDNRNNQNNVNHSHSHTYYQQMIEKTCQ